jgi:predicted alpha/beta superfamily hydrolase
MKKILLAIFITGILSVLGTLIFFEIKAQRDQLEASSIQIIKSKILGEHRKLLIHLPKGYSKNIDIKYPVIYALDATSHDKDILNASTILSLAGFNPELIIVGIVNENRNLDLTPHYLPQEKESTELGRGNKFLDFLEKEAIPVINKNYRTSDYKMLSGNSRAGLFTFYSMLEKPNYFDAYFCYSPSFWKGENKISEKLQESMINGELKNFIYLSIGEDENEKMISGFDKVANIFDQSDIQNAKIYFEYTKNASHGNNAFYSIPGALRIWNKIYTTEHATR